MGLETIAKGDKQFVRQLERDFPEVKFVWGAPRFSYRMTVQRGKKLKKDEQPVVFLGEPQPNFALLALHELGHALCKHKDYKVDVERIKIESDAWERAKMVWSHYQEEWNERKMSAERGEKLISGCNDLPGCDELSRCDDLPRWDDDFVQEKLDTYRDWLHAKSRCKKCGLTRYQTDDGNWHCPRCEVFTL